MKSVFFWGKGRRGKALVSVQRIYPVAVFCVGGQFPELEKPLKKSWIAFFSPSLVSLYNKCPPPGACVVWRLFSCFTVGKSCRLGGDDFFSAQYVLNGQNILCHLLCNITVQSGFYARSVKMKF